MYYREFRNFIKRIKFYIILLGAFLGLEIPLIIFTYFKIFSKYRNFIWIITLLVGIACAFVVLYVITGIIKEDYKTKILFDEKNYNGGENEKA